MAVPAVVSRPGGRVQPGQEAPSTDSRRTFLRDARLQRTNTFRAEHEKTVKKERYPASWYSKPREQFGTGTFMVVPWDVVNYHWRNALRQDSRARRFFDEHLTPKTFPQTYLHSVYSPKLAGLTLAEARHPDTDQVTIFVDTVFLKFIYEALRLVGIHETFLRNSFKAEWLRDPGDLADFAAKPCPRLDMLQLKMEELSLTVPRSLSPPISNSIPAHAIDATPPPTSAAPFLPHLPFPTPSCSSRESSVDLSESMVLKRRYSDDTSLVPEAVSVPSEHVSLSTPAPSSLESSPEPPALKRPKVEDPMVLRGMQQDLKLMRREWPFLQSGAGTFFAIDVELWEFDQKIMTEFGFASLVYGPGGVKQYETKHFVVKENAHRRNFKYVKDARDDFGYGKSLGLSQSTIFALFESLFDVYSTPGPLFLLFHDPRVDLDALELLGFERNRFQNLDSFDKRGGGGGIYVVDTQRLYSAHVGNSAQRRLEHCAKTFGLETAKLHNAGNDAKATLDLAESILSRKARPRP